MKLHRVTLWRRERGAGKNGVGRAGRKLWSEAGADVLIQFVAAVLDLQNTRGFCDWPEVRPACRKYEPGCLFHPAGAKLTAAVRALAGRYHPGMLAAAVCELVPLNYWTRGGPGSASKRDLGWRARRTLGRAADESDPRPLSAETLDLNKHDRPDGGPESEVDQWQARLESVMSEQEAALWALRGEAAGFDEAWQAELLKLIHPVARERGHVRKVKGTPVHRLPLFGMEPSRKMASHWRHHPDYRKALGALRRLLVGSEPVAPYAGGEFPGAQIDKLGTEAFRQFWIQRRKARAAGGVVTSRRPA